MSLPESAVPWAGSAKIVRGLTANATSCTCHPASVIASPSTGYSNWAPQGPSQLKACATGT